MVVLCFVFALFFIVTVTSPVDEHQTLLQAHLHEEWVASSF